MKRTNFAVAVSVLAILASAYVVGASFLKNDCSANLCSQSIEVRSEEFTIQPGSLEERSIQCGEDQKVVGGGFKIADDSKLFVWKNSPFEDGKGWGFGISNYGQAARVIRFYAIMVSVK
jgi:hypothetical protein